MKKLLIVSILCLFTVGSANAFLFPTVKAFNKQITEVKKVTDNINAGLLNASSRIDEFELSFDTEINGLKSSIGTLNSKIETVINTNVKLQAKVSGLDLSINSKSGRDTNVNDVKLFYILGATNIITLVGFLLMMSKFTTTNKELDDKDKWSKYLERQKEDYKNKLLSKEGKNG